MSGLSAGFFAGGLFDDGLGRLGRIGGGRQRGVGGVFAELFFEGTDALSERGKLLLQACDDLVTLPTTRTRRRIHTRILGIEAASSCAKGKKSTERLPRAGAAEEHDRDSRPGLTGDQSRVPLLRFYPILDTNSIASSMSFSAYI